MPSHASADRGHYSQWEASSTTFGPAFKVGASVVLVAVLAIGFFLVFFIIWFVQLFLTGWILKELWRPAWIVPTADGDASRPPPADPVEPFGKASACRRLRNARNRSPTALAPPARRPASCCS